MSDSHDHSHGASSGGPGYELRDIAFRPVILGLAGIIALIAGSMALVWMLLSGIQEGRRAEEVTLNPLSDSMRRRVPPEPRLQANPRGDLADVRAAEEEILHSYGWIDRQNEIVRIPIDWAMALTLQRGLPARAGER